MSLKDLILQARRHSTVFALCGTLLVPAVAQRPTPLPIEDVLSARSFADGSPIQFSPDSKWLAYTVAEDRRSELQTTEDFLRAGLSTAAKSTDVFVVETTTGDSRSITDGQGENWLPAWSPDGRYLAMVSDRDGSGLAKLWVWEAAKGTLRKVSDVNVRTTRLQWLPDSRTVVASVLPEHVTAAEFTARLTGPMKSNNGRPQRGSSDSTVEVYRSVPQLEGNGQAQQSPPWSLDYALSDLALIDVGGGNVRRIDRGHRILAFFLSPDGSQVAYTSPQSFEKPGSQQILFDIALISLKSHQLSTVASAVPLAFGGGAVNWSPDGSMLAYRTGGMGGSGDCYIVDWVGGKVRNVTNFTQPHAGYADLPPLWDTKGQQIFFTDGSVLWAASPDGSQATAVAKPTGHVLSRLIPDGKGAMWSVDGGESVIVPAFDRSSKRLDFYRVYSQSSRMVPVLTVSQTLVGLQLDFLGAVTDDGRQFAYFSQDAAQDMDLWLTDAHFAPSRRLTHLNPQFERYEMGSARLIDWLSLDGERLQGSLLLPSGYLPGTRYPLLVWVYGGEQGSDYIGQFGLLGGWFNLQLFATRGYAVLFPDVPQHLGTPMADLAKDVLPGINKIIEMGIADESRVGVLGQSYGGYSVLSLLVQSRRFKAAATIDGPGDLISFYGEMGEDGTAYGTGVVEGGQGLLGGSPWEFRSRYIENSPVFYLDRIDTPLLIVHGTSDFVVAPFLSDEIFVDLRRLGKRAEYAKYLGEGHVPSDWSRADQSDLWERVLAWFHTYLTKARDATQ